MAERFIEILSVGGKSNSLGRVNEVIELVLRDRSRLEELYASLSAEDAWVRMRAADALEKVCRLHPDWLEPYIDIFQDELASSSQPSILWHLAQIYSQVYLTPDQKIIAIDWLKNLLSSTDVDWIVSANAMETLVQFTKDGFISAKDTAVLLNIQQKHASKSVVKKAIKLLLQLH